MSNMLLQSLCGVFVILNRYNIGVKQGVCGELVHEIQILTEHINQTLLVSRIHQSCAELVKSREMFSL